MAFRHQNIRTSQKGRRPIESDLLDGQLAVNFNEETPGIFFKTDQGDVLKAGPTHIGTEPPLLVKQANYGVGETWFDLNAGIIKIWDGDKWRETSFPVDVGNCRGSNKDRFGLTGLIVGRDLVCVVF